MEEVDDGAWVPPKTSEQEAIERSRQTALRDTRRWVEDLCGQKFDDPTDFRGSLRNGILLCEVLNKLKPGCIKRINRRPTPIAGLDNLSVFLTTLEKDFGFSRSQLFDVKDLEDIAEKFHGDILQNEEESRALRVAVTLYWLSEYCVTREATSGAISSDSQGRKLKPIDSTFFISGTVLHRRQSFALSSDGDSLVNMNYQTSGVPTRHNNDSVGGTSFDSLDDSRASQAAYSITGGSGVRFQKRDANDLAREAERQMEVARINRTVASSMRTIDSNDDEWRSNLSDWRERRRRQHQSSNIRSSSVDKELEERNEGPENPKPFKKMVEESNKRRRSFNLLYPVEDEEINVFDIPDNAIQTTAATGRATGYSTSVPENAPWAVEKRDEKIVPKSSTASLASPLSKSSTDYLKEENRKKSPIEPRPVSPSDTSSSDNERSQVNVKSVQKRSVTIRLTRRQGHRVEKHFGLALVEKNQSVIVNRVVRGSIADVNEVHAGDQIVSIDAQPVSKVADALEYLDRNSVQLCVRRTASDEEDLSDDMSEPEDATVAKPPALSGGPPSNLPPLRSLSSSSSTKHSGEEGPSATDRHSRGEQSEGTSMINGLLSAARSGELDVGPKPDDSCDYGESRKPSTSHEETEESAANLSVKQRISTIESRNQFFGVKADSEEKKYKEIEQSSRPVSFTEDNVNTASQALPWQRKQEFRPIRPRWCTGREDYQRPLSEGEKESSRPSDETNVSARGVPESERGTARILDGAKPQSKDSRMDAALSSNAVGESWSASTRLEEKRVEDERKTAAVNVKAQEVAETSISESKESQVEIISSPLPSGCASAPPVRDSRARHAHQRPFSDLREKPSDAAISPPASTKALSGHMETIDDEVYKLERLQLELGKPSQSSHHNATNQEKASSSNLTLGSIKNESHTFTGSVTDDGFPNEDVSDLHQEDKSSDGHFAVKQPYPQNYTSEDQFKVARAKQSDRGAGIFTEPSLPQKTPDRPAPQEASSTERSYPLHCEVQSRHSSSRVQFSRENAEPVRPKSLISDRSANIGSSSLSPELSRSVRASHSDTQLTSAAPAPPAFTYSQQFPHTNRNMPVFGMPSERHSPSVEEQYIPAMTSVNQFQSYDTHHQPQAAVKCVSGEQQSKLSSNFDQPHQSRSPQRHQYPTTYTFTADDSYVQRAADDPLKPTYLPPQQTANIAHPYSRSQRTDIQLQQPRQHRIHTSTSMILSESGPPRDIPPLSTSMYDFHYRPSHPAKTSRSTVDDSILAKTDRPVLTLPQGQAASVIQQRHTIQRTAPPASAPQGKIPISRSVDSGLFHHMRSQAQNSSVSNPVYGCSGIDEPKRAHSQGHVLITSQRHWFVDEALRRQQAERDAYRRKENLPVSRSQDCTSVPQPQHQQHIRRDAPSTLEKPPALPPRIKSSAAMAAAMQRPRPVLNSRAPCCACNQPLGTGDLMTIESLHLSFHLQCFRCVACQTMLGSGRQDADVRVRGNRLYCFNCSALEEGTIGGGSVGRRGGRRF